MNDHSDPDATVTQIIEDALTAAYEAGEQARIANRRNEWTDEEIDAAAAEMRRHLLGES